MFPQSKLTDFVPFHCIICAICFECCLQQTMHLFALFMRQLLTASVLSANRNIGRTSAAILARRWGTHGWHTTLAENIAILCWPKSVVPSPEHVGRNFCLCSSRPLLLDVNHAHVPELAGADQKQEEWNACIQCRQHVVD